MKKTLFSMIAVLAFAVLGTSCQKVTYVPLIPDTKELVQTDKGSTFTIVKGQKLSITVNDPRDGGATMQDPYVNNGILRYDRMVHVANNNDTPGAYGGKNIYEFTAIDNGTSNVSLDAIRVLYDGNGNSYYTYIPVFACTIIVKEPSLVVEKGF